MTLPEIPTPPDKKTNWISGAIFLFLGLVALGIIYFVQQEQLASQTWPNTEGVVVAAYLEEYRDADQELSYTPRVKYEYTVEGQRYGSQKIRSGIEQSYGFPNNAQKELDPYPVGLTVTVYYDPAQPTNAMLDRTVTNTTPWYIGAGGTTFLGIYLLVNSARKKN